MPHQLRLGLRAAHDLLELGQERLRGHLVTELQIDEHLVRLGDAAAHSVGLHALLGTEPLVLVEVRLPGVEVLDGVLDVNGGHCPLLGSVEDQTAPQTHAVLSLIRRISAALCWAGGCCAGTGRPGRGRVPPAAAGQGTARGARRAGAPGRPVRRGKPPPYSTPVSPGAPAAAPPPRRCAPAAPPRYHPPRSPAPAPLRT